MKIYNTKTGQKEEFIVRDNRVRMYVCGPTVYNLFHVGNARVFVVFDLLRKYFEHKGQEVMYVQNFTDIDDKLIRKAAEEGTTVKEVADKYIDEYFKDAQGLGIKPANVHPRATENINGIISMIKTLIDKGHAYVSEGDVYFDTQSYDKYGAFSGHNMEDLEAGVRVDIVENKKHHFDFVLWKAQKDADEISWQSPWGKGRPGWHIECSVMVYEHLGTDIDIHGGGPDLVFPHHENEIAQTECATGEQMSRFWMHVGFINIDNRKMSKSFGNFFMVRDVADKYGYQPIRFFLLASHYKSPINFSAEIIEQAKASLERLHNCSDSLNFRLSNTPKENLLPQEEEYKTNITGLKDDFYKALEDDFNTAGAIGALFEMVREINTSLTAPALSREYLVYALEIFGELCEFLGFTKQTETTDLSDYIEEMIAKRNEARQQKDFQTADQIRDTLRQKGIVLEDTPQGVKWKKI